jgi:hypothetical protein
MNNFSINQVSRTVGSVTVAGVMATQLLIAGVSLEKGGEEQSHFKRHVYEASVTLPTFDQYRNLLTGDYAQASNELEEAMSDLYARLVAGQESLGSEFETVLDKNRWDLYES